MIFIFYSKMVRIPQLGYYSSILDLELNLEYKLIDFRLQTRRLEMMASGLYTNVSQ